MVPNLTNFPVPDSVRCVNTLRYATHSLGLQAKPPETSLGAEITMPSLAGDYNACEAEPYQECQHSGSLQRLYDQLSILPPQPLARGRDWCLGDNRQVGGQGLPPSHHSQTP